MAKEDFFSRKLKDLDVFKRLPKELSKGSLFGVLLSVITIGLIGMLLLNEIILFLSFSVESGVKIDHKRDSGQVEVHIDIIFKNHPCHFLGLDYVDYVGSHNKNVIEKLNYINQPQSTLMSGKQASPFNRSSFKNDDEILDSFAEAMKNKIGCRIKGSFKVLLVPGNFHIGFHSSGHLIQKYMAKIGRRFPVDFTHEIHYIYFGKTDALHLWKNYKRDFRLKNLNTFSNFQSTTMVQQPGDFSYKYKLMIVPTNLEYENGRKESMFQYKSFWNVAYYEPNFNYMLSFDYDLSSVTMTEKRIKKTFNEFLIHICGIVGGCVAFASFIHMLL